MLKNPYKYWQTSELIAVAKRHRSHFRAGNGWYYSNTNYVLLGMIIENITGDTVKQALNKRLLKQPGYNLVNTFYINDQASKSILSKMTHGYYIMADPISVWLDITDYSLSSLNAAGSIISNTRDLIHWYDLLFNGKTLPQSQLHEMMSLVSIKTGKSIDRATVSDSDGYGLGIRQYYDENVGEIWWHDGGTGGYTSIVMWIPKLDVIMAVSIDTVIEGHEADGYPPSSEFIQSILSIINS